MNFQIVCGSIGFDPGELESFFPKLKLEEHHVAFASSPENADGSIQILVERDGRDFSLKIPRLGFFKKSSSHDLLSTLKSIIVSCAGHKKNTLIGLTIKDCQGNKIKPEIDIYSPRSLLVEFPDVLEYTKSKISVQRSALTKTKIAFHSEILSTILMHTPLSFAAHGKIYELVVEGNVPYIYHKDDAPTASADFLTSYTISKDFLSIINSQPGPISSHFRSILNCEPSPCPKNLFRNLAKHRKDMDYVLKIVEHAPRFQDSRDGLIEEFRDFLISSYHKEIINKYDYLEVVKQTIPKNKNKFSLRSFLSP